MPNDVCMHHALPILFEIFRKLMQKLKFKGSINLLNIDRPHQNRILASCEACDGVMDANTQI